jgi:hypothetical protein
LSISLDRIIYGNLRAKDSNGDGITVIGLTDGLTVQDGLLWHGFTSVQAMPGETPESTRALGLFAAPGDRFVFACAYLQDGNPQWPLYEYVLLPRVVLETLAGNLQPLVALFRDPIARDQTISSQVESLELPNPTAWTAEDRRASLDDLLNHDPALMPRALALLGAALHERGLLIYGFPGDAEARVRLVQGLMALLPAHVRPDLTFSTNRHEQTSTHARVVFAERTVTSGRWVADWEAQTYPPAEAQTSPYIQHLQSLWTGDIDSLLEQIETMNAITAPLNERNLQNTLSVIAERHALDARVKAGENVPIDAVKTALKEPPPSGDLKAAYATRLLRHALETRDADAALLVANLMDDDAALDDLLYGLLNDALETEPDAVYAFIRARLSANLDDRWLDRLRTAALASLQVAITDGDSETVLNWLRLLAREPAAYGLSEIVHNGILAAQPRARGDEELARGLVVLAIRRDPAAARALTDDSELMAILPNNLGRALRDFDGDPAALLEAHGVETLLAALARAAQVRRPAMFTPMAVEQVWSAFTGAQPVSAIIKPAPDQIVTGWINDGPGWLPAAAIDTLLTLALRDRRDDIFHQLIHPLASREDLVSLLSNALWRSGRSVNDVLALIGQVIAVGDLSQQGAVDLYITLLDVWEWKREYLPLMAQLARTVQQAPALTVSDDVLWQLLAVAAEAREELIARVVVRRITAELETMDEDATLAEDLQTLIESIQWNQHLRGQVMTWWRGFARAQSQTRLQRLEKQLESRRALDDLRTVNQSLLAFRKMLGKRPLGQFAGDISIAFVVLQALAESYDPSKRPSGFDPATIRAEFDARKDELSPNDLKILANNFKELAQLVGSMGDNRSKATLMRRGDDVDRQLMTGEQPPHSAVDALKWMAGYLSGMQEKPEEGESTG